MKLSSRLGAPFLLFLLLSSAILLWSCAAASNEKEQTIDQQLEKLAASHGILLFFKGDPSRFFHPSWQKEPVNAKAEALTDNEKKMMLEPLQKALSLYPKSFVKSHIGSIVLLKSLSLYGSSYAGTYTVFKTPGYNLLYLTRGSVTDKDFASFFIDSFHHELSSVLMEMHPFPEKEWRVVNGESFKYRYEHEDSPGLSALKDDVSTGFSIQMVANGFLSEYAMSSLEEDVNVFVAVALKDPQWMSELAVEHIKIKQKLNLMMRFYVGIDKAFAQSEPYKFYRAKGLLDL